MKNTVNTSFDQSVSS